MLNSPVKPVRAVLRAGLFESEPETVEDIYWSIVAELDYLLLVPQIDLIQVDLNQSNTEEYALAAKQNNLTQQFRFSQSQARFLAMKVEEGFLFDTLGWLLDKNSIVIPGVKRLLSYVNKHSLACWNYGSFGRNDQDSIKEIELKCQR